MRSEPRDLTAPLSLVAENTTEHGCCEEAEPKRESVVHSWT
jgi:hypothetical protein